MALDILTAKDVEDTVKARKQPMGTVPKGGMPQENDMGPLPANANKAKGIELKLGPASRDKPTNLNPVSKKKGGTIRGNGLESKGKTKGKFI